MYIRFLWEMLAFITFALTQGLCAGHDLRQMLRRGLDSRKVYSECMKQDRLTKFWWWDETQLLLSQLSQTRWAIPQETPPGWRRSGWISPHTFVTWCGLTGEMTHECCVSQWYQEFPDHLTRSDILDDSIRSQLTFFPVCYITRDIRVCTIRWHISECKVMTASWM